MVGGFFFLDFWRKANIVLDLTRVHVTVTRTINICLIVRRNIGENRDSSSGCRKIGKKKSLPFLHSDLFQIFYLSTSRWRSLQQCFLCF